MDGKRFDKLTRIMASGSSRRSVLKGLLGIGGAAAVSTVVAESTDARRSSRKPGPTAVLCPDQDVCGTFCCDSNQCNAFENGCCPEGTSACDTNSTGCCADCELGGVSCGYDCCETEAQCCDGECCQTNHTCIAEEICCRNDLICDVHGGCCADGEKCCIRDGVSYCIPESGCCLIEDCPISDNQCLDPVCPVGSWQCSTVPKPDETLCDDGDACTTGDRCIAGECLSTGDLQCLPTNECFEVTGCDPASGCQESYRGNGEECGAGICFEEDCCTPLSQEAACGTQCGGTADRGCGLTAECGAGTCEDAVCVQLMDSGSYVCRTGFNCYRETFDCKSDSFCSPGLCDEKRCIMCDSNENCSQSGANSACAVLVSHPDYCQGDVACVAP